MIVQKLKKDFFLNFLNYLVDFARQAVPLRGDDAGGRERERDVLTLNVIEKMRDTMSLDLLWRAGGKDEKKGVYYRLLFVSCVGNAAVIYTPAVS